MRLFDTHVHVGKAPFYTSGLLRQMDDAGIEVSVLLSEEPDRGRLPERERTDYNRTRLQRVTDLAGESERLLAAYFINVIESDALQQVDMALEAGIAGFKVICADHYPGDERALPVYRHIAAAGKPVLFHSGILWDFGANANYNRPGNFEVLLFVPRLRFALAHIGWPWCDEMIAVYGKFLAMRDMPDYTGQEMYIDMTPGTPHVYRREVITRLLTVGYEDMTRRLLYGSDCFTDVYSGEYARDWAETDEKIFTELGMAKDIQDDIFYNNAARFWNFQNSNEPTIRRQN